MIVISKNKLGIDFGLFVSMITGIIVIVVDTGTVVGAQLMLTATQHQSID